MALESLVNNEFSSASDLWAFRVMLWELAFDSGPNVRIHKMLSLTTERILTAVALGTL